MMKDFEPASETMIDDLSGGAAGHSRHHMRVREIALQTMVQQTAQSRLQRAMNSNTRLAVQHLDLNQGDFGQMMAKARYSGRERLAWSRDSGRDWDATDNQVAESAPYRQGAGCAPCYRVLHLPHELYADGL